MKKPANYSINPPAGGTFGGISSFWRTPAAGYAGR
jgi:hypothetical protein